LRRQGRDLPEDGPASREALRSAPAGGSTAVLQRPALWRRRRSIFSRSATVAHGTRTREAYSPRCVSRCGSVTPVTLRPAVHRAHSHASAAVRLRPEVVRSQVAADPTLPPSYTVIIALRSSDSRAGSTTPRRTLRCSSRLRTIRSVQESLPTQ
jgi:hypothetical protein